MTQKVKNILFISYDGMTDPLGQSQVIPYLQGLSDKGFRFFLLSCEKKQAFAENESEVRKMLAGYAIQWIPIAYTRKPPVLSTLKDVIQLKRKAKAIHRQYRIDMVHTRPGIPALVGLWMKKTLGVKFLHDVREFYADSRIDGEIWNLRNPIFKTIYSFFKRKEAQQIKHSDGLVCLTHAAKKIIQQLPAYCTSKPMQVIPCSADLQLFDPAKISLERRQQLQQQLGISSSDIIISYLGSIGGWYMTADMLRFCKAVSDRMPRVRFLFISPHHHSLINAEATRYGLPADKLIVTHGKRSEVPALLSLSTYSVFFIKPCFSKLSSSPTKHGEIMAMGIPVITNSGVGDVKEIAQRYKSGYVVDRFDAAAYDQVIDQLAEGNPFNATAIRAGATDFYALDNAVSLYEKMYHAILNQVQQ